MNDNYRHADSFPTAADPSEQSGAGAGLRADTLADSVLILLGLAVVQRLGGFIRAILFCRYLEPEQLGQWDMAFSFLVLAAPLSILAIPSSFGRYVEHYRKQGQLRTLFGRTATVCICLAAVAFVVIFLARERFSQLLFGTPDRTELVVMAAVSLLAVIAFGFLTESLTALRNIRLLSLMQLFNSLVFAALGILLLFTWQQTAASIVVAYGGACCLSVLWVAWRTRRSWDVLPPAKERLAQGTFWAKLTPFVAWVSVACLLANMFEIADRYMILHFSPGTAAEALTQIGYYHSSRIVPLLLVSIALMLGGILMPHLSHDWEAGRRERVGIRLNLFLKLLCFGLSSVAVIVLFAAPLLFGVAFRGRLDGGLPVLPWTLTYCIWFGMAMVAESYLWCAEKARLASLALLIGLAVNVGLNLLLLPRLGLLGAVLATTVANFVALTLICTFNHLLGFRLDPGTRLVLLLPVSLGAGPWVAITLLLAVAIEALRTDRLLSREEKQQLAETWSKYRSRFRPNLAQTR